MYDVKNREKENKKIKNKFNLTVLFKTSLNSKCTMN